MNPWRCLYKQFSPIHFFFVLVLTNLCISDKWIFFVLVKRHEIDFVLYTTRHNLVQDELVKVLYLTGLANSQQTPPRNRHWGLFSETRYRTILGQLSGHDWRNCPISLAEVISWFPGSTCLTHLDPSHMLSSINYLVPFQCQIISNASSWTSMAAHSRQWECWVRHPANLSFPIKILLKT